MKRRTRILLGLGVATLAGALLCALYVNSIPHSDSQPHPFNHDRNAVWLEHRWIEKLHSETECEDLIKHLAERGVLYLYPHMIPFDRQGQLPPHDYDQMRTLLAVANRVAPRMRILPWVGGLRVGFKRMRAGTLDLANLEQRQRMVAECRGLIDEGFAGIHLNIEPINDGNDDYLALLRALRTAVGSGRVLSVAGTRPGPISLPVAPNFFWTAEYYRRVGGLVDQVVVMAYDTGLPSPGLYQRYLAYTALTLAPIFERPPMKAHWMIGVPTYDAQGLMHRAGVETLDNALLGAVAGLRESGAGGAFEGVALYAEWTTDAAEWNSYERLWRGTSARSIPPVSTPTP
ncbi:MAG: glycoside hydrolase family 18 protein [Vicinamibacteria bacterium]|jgi:hypothetical protein|nr:glycoside hydrolase family 18 protein [Vicinamibacteria bacterium]